MWLYIVQIPFIEKIAIISNLQCEHNNSLLHSYDGNVCSLTSQQWRKNASIFSWPGRKMHQKMVRTSRIIFPLVPFCCFFFHWDSTRSLAVRKSRANSVISRAKPWMLFSFTVFGEVPKYSNIEWNLNKKRKILENLSFFLVQLVLPRHINFGGGNKTSSCNVQPQG